MELRHVRYFVAVAEELHFGRAAERLHLAQPPLSRQIQQLEDEIGVVLLDRNRRKVELTDAGKEFLNEARKLLADADHAIVAAQRAARGELGTLSIAFVSSTSYVFLPKVLTAFRSRYPNVDLSLHEMSSGEQIEALLECRVHVGFIRPAMPHRRLVHEVVLQEDVVMALPVNHPLSQPPGQPQEAEPLALSAFADDPFILFRRQPLPSFGEQTIGFCAEAGFAPQIAQEAREMATALSLVAVGMGVALVPETARAIPWPGVAYRRIHSPSPTTELVMAYHRDETSAVLSAFRAIVQENS